MEKIPIFRYETQATGNISLEILMKFKSYLIPDAKAFDSAANPGVQVSEVVKTPKSTTAKVSNQKAWFDENRGAFSAQSEWHETRGHPLAEIIVSPIAASWS